MHAQSKKKKGKKNKGESDKHCENCDKSGHVKDDCWAPGGGKEGQGLKQEKKGSEDQKKNQWQQRQQQKKHLCLPVLPHLWGLPILFKSPSRSEE